MKHIYTDNTILVADKKYTFTSADFAAAVSTLTVDSIIGFSAGDILLLGDLGNENSEIIKVHTDDPTGSSIKLASSTVFAHSQGTKIYILDYDQIRISHADTTTGAKTTLATIDLQADSKETVYKDTAKSAGYYFTSFYDGTNYSSYSDPIPYIGFGANTVQYAIEYALKRNKTDFTDNVDHNFCIEEINSCLQYIHGKRKKWSKLQEFDYVLGQTEDMEWAFDVPSNMWGYSNKSILDIHLEEYGSLIYQDEREWNELMEDVYYDTLSEAALDEAVAVTLTNSFGFGDTGTAYSRGDTITYTANNTSTGVLTCSALDNALASGSMVWGGDFQEGQPKYYTIKEDKVYIYPLPDSSYDNINVMVDYWKEASSVDSDADTLDISRYDMVKSYLTAVIRWQLKDDGKVDLTDGDYILFEKKLDDCIRIEMNTTSQKFKWKPKLNRMRF